MEAKIQALMAKYPDCDYTMAETLFKMHEQGKLKDYDFATPKACTPSEPGKIYVVSQENKLSAEKSELPSIACEANLAD
jgi:hypothetical protein